jgi:hypothetical protein
MKGNPPLKILLSHPLLVTGIAGIVEVEPGHLVEADDSIEPFALQARKNSLHERVASAVVG